MKRLALIGSKAFAQGLIEDLRIWKLFDVVGYFDDFEEKDTIINGLPILGNCTDIIRLFQDNLFDCVFIASGYNNLQGREILYNSLKNKVPLANIISPNSIIHPTATIGEGILISDGSVIHKHAVIEDNVAITLHSIVNHGSIVKKHTFFSTRVTTAGNVVVGERCFVGVGVVISDGIKICDDTWLSPGSVVIKNITKPGHYISTAAKLVNIG